VFNCPSVLVPQPPVDASGGRGGLFAAAQFPQLPDGHWQCGGVAYEQETCGTVHGWSQTCPPTAPLPKVTDLTWPLVEGTVFVVTAGVTCSKVGYSLEEFRRRVTNQFIANEQRAVERIFWTGELGNEPHLADPDCTVLAGATVAAPLTLRGGVAALESFLGDNYGYTGVIHAPRGVSVYAADARLIENAPARPVTPLGTRWAFGGGYSVNTGPDGTPAPDGVAWLYATGQVNIWQGEVINNPEDLEAAFNTKTNEVTVIAEREYVITRECVCAAVPISIGCAC
jgi:hypothetical protein